MCSLGMIIPVMRLNNAIRIIVRFCVLADEISQGLKRFQTLSKVPYIHRGL